MGCASLVCFDRGASSRGGVTACRTRARAIEVKAPDARTIFAAAVKVGGDGRGWVNVVRALTTVASKVGAGTPQMAGSAARLCHAGVANPTQPPTTCENFNR